MLPCIVYQKYADLTLQIPREVVTIQAKITALSYPITCMHLETKYRRHYDYHLTLKLLLRILSISKQLVVSLNHGQLFGLLQFEQAVVNLLQLLDHHFAVVLDSSQLMREHKERQQGERGENEVE